MVGKKIKLKPITKEDYFKYENKKDIRNFSFSLNYNGPIVAPINKNEKIAEIIVLNKDEIIKNFAFNQIAQKSYKKCKFF